MGPNGNGEKKDEGGMGCDPSTPETVFADSLKNESLDVDGSLAKAKPKGSENKNFQFAWPFCRGLTSCLPEFIDVGKLDNRFIAKDVDGSKTLDSLKLLSAISYALKEGNDISASAERAVNCARVTRASWNPEAQGKKNPDAKFLCKAKAFVERKTQLDASTYSEPMPLKAPKKASMREGSGVSGKVIKKKPCRKPATRTPPAKGVGKGSGMLAGGKSPVEGMLASVAAILQAKMGAAPVSLTPRGSRNAA